MSKPALLDSISPGYKQLAAALVSAGLDPAAVLAAPDSLKAHLDQAVAAASASVDVAAAVTAATSELQKQLTQQESARALFDAQLAAIGFKVPAVQGKDGAAPTIEESTAAFQEAFKAHVSASVTQKIQEIGFPAGKLPKATHDESSKEMSYEDFSKLPPAAKMEFCTTGGRLTSSPITGRN